MKVYPITDVRGNTYINPAPPETRAEANIQKATSWLSSYAQALSSVFSGDRTYKASLDCSSRYENCRSLYGVHRADALTQPVSSHSLGMYTNLAQGLLSLNRQSILGHAFAQRLQRPYLDSSHAIALSESYPSLGYGQSYSHHKSNGLGHFFQSLCHSIYMVLVSSFSSRYSYNNTGVL